jgi:hypothetical protein
LNSDELENRLRAVRPPDPPWELVLRLRDAQPGAPPQRWWRWPGGVFGGPWHPWRVAYAGVLAAWAVIVVLHLLTLPLLPASAGQTSIAQTSLSPAPADAPMLDRTFLLTRNNTLDPAWQ